MYIVLFFKLNAYVQKQISSKQRICGLASDERMMDAKYLNHKFKLFSFYEMFLVINHVELNRVSLKNYHFVIRLEFVKVNCFVQGRKIDTYL